MRYDKPSWDRRRDDPDQAFLASADWEKIRLVVLATNPLCTMCGRVNRVTAADQVHHIVPPRGNPHLQRAYANLMPLCASCHARITRGLRYLWDLGADGYPIDPMHPQNRSSRGRTRRRL